ncbi:hypothetical protein [Phormidium nigroviride]
MGRERKNPPEDPTVEAGVVESIGSIKKPRWYRYEVKWLLGRGKSMPETTFKRRLMLLEEEVPEFNKTPYHRQFSSFQVWCLVTQETWIKEANYCIDSVRKQLANEGLPTHEYNEQWRPNN